MAAGATAPSALLSVHCRHEVPGFVLLGAARLVEGIALLRDEKSSPCLEGVGGGVVSGSSTLQRQPLQIPGGR